MNGSPTCTVGRRCLGVLVERRRGHGRPVDAVAPGLVADVEDRSCRRPRARARKIWSARTSPTHITFTSGLPAYSGANAISPPTVGQPKQLP